MLTSCVFVPNIGKPRAAVCGMKLPRPAFCPAFRRRFFSSPLSASGRPSCGAFASAGCAGRVSGHCSDFLCAVLRGFDDRFARLRRYGSNHRFPSSTGYRRNNAACPSRFPGIASGPRDRSDRTGCAVQWMRMSAAIGFCAMYFQRETPCASAPATGCCCWIESARRVGCGSAAARADAGLYAAAKFVPVIV